MGPYKVIYKDAVINGVTNAIFNGYIAWLILRDRTILSMWGDGGFGFDILATAFILLFIVTLIVVPLSRRKVLQGKLRSIHLQAGNPIHSFLRYMPAGLLWQALAFGLIGLFIVAPLTLVMLWLLGAGSLGPLAFALIKGGWAGVLAGTMVIPMILLAVMKEQLGALKGVV